MSSEQKPPVVAVPEHLHTVTPRLVVRDGARAMIYPLADRFYGERGGRLRDPFGQQWMLSQRIETVPPDEMKRRSDEFFS
jgi:hypothetical protein